MPRSELPTIKITQSASSESEYTATASDNETSSNARRTKRKMDRGLGMNELFMVFKDEVAEIFEKKFDKLHTELVQLQKQNQEMVKSMEFMTLKYDEVRDKLDQFHKERDNDRLYISTLEEKLENIERNRRASTIEIKNIPRKQGETKADLIKLTSSISSALDLNIQKSEIENAYRISLKKEGNPPVLVKFTTVVRKEEVLDAVKKFNKINKVKLNTQHLELNSPIAPVFITEHLTAKTSKLFFQCRDFARAHDYRFCWCSRGKIFLRKQEGDRFIMVVNEKQLDELKSKV